MEGSESPREELVQRAYTEPNFEPPVLAEDLELEGRPAQANILPALVPGEQESQYRFQPHVLTCRLALFGLKQSDLLKLSELLRACAPQVALHTSETPLLKSQLRGYEYHGIADLAVLHHRAEGRLLLTDRNGYYHDLLASLYRACGMI
jgi:hypothetical protein